MSKIIPSFLLMIIPLSIPIVLAFLGNSIGRRVNPGLFYGLVAGIYIALLVVLLLSLWRSGLKISCYTLVVSSAIILFFTPFSGGLLGAIWGKIYSMTGKIKLGALFGLYFGYLLTTGFGFMVLFGPCIGKLYYDYSLYIG